MASYGRRESHRLVEYAGCCVALYDATASGHIINTSSIAGRKVFKGLSVYCATKHAVAAFSDGLRMELAPKHNIRVTCIHPGAVESELFENISDKDYADQMEELKDQMEFLKAADIAETILFALNAPNT
jgi:NADP-dependent 3-hydroxy acid dehydrogenase YdfG